MTEKRFTHTDLHYMSFNEILELLNNLNDENEQLKKQLKDNTDFLIRSAERLGFKSLDHLLYTLDKGEIYGYSTANWGELND